jgi:hypothetical protein
LKVQVSFDALPLRTFPVPRSRCVRFIGLGALALFVLLGTSRLGTIPLLKRVDQSGNRQRLS